MKENRNDKVAEGEKVVWADDGPGQARGFELLHPTIGRPVEGVLLTDDVAGVMLHWQDGRSFPCVKGECQRQHTARDPYWHGYTALGVRGAVVPTVLGVSAGAYRQLARLAEEYDGVRGLYVRLSRDGEQRSRVKLQLLSSEKVCSIPAGFDVRPLLLAMWFPELADAAQPRKTSPAETAARGRLARITAGLFQLNGHTEGGAY